MIPALRSLALCAMLLFYGAAGFAQKNGMVSKNPSAEPSQKDVQKSKEGLKNENVSDTNTPSSVIAGEKTPDGQAAENAVKALRPPALFDENDSAYDDGAPSVVAQIFKTVLALAFIIGLIYLSARLGLGRLSKLRQLGGGGLEVESRLVLDAKNSVFVVRLKSGERILLGGGEQGIQSSLILRNEAGAQQKQFRDVLDSSANSGDAASADEAKEST